MKNLYTENDKTLMRELEEDTNKQKKFCAHGFKELTLLKMSILPKAIYRFKEISVRVPRAFFSQKYNK